MKTVVINDKEYPVYATLEDAENYFAGVYNAGWTDIDDEKKAVLLVSATMTIDKGQWNGEKKDESHDLEFPRIINGIETEEKRVINACCEEALAIYNSGRTDTANTQGIKSMQVQDTQIEFKESAESGYFQSDSAYDWLYPYLLKSTRIIF